ncbi:MAG: YbjN domain-containing protein [Bacteroidetes bacterium]|nr:YbjN domain-containing protein [Bacteroidota bacterium]
MELTPYYQLVEQAIYELGLNPADCRGEQQGSWNLRKGSATVYVNILPLAEQDGTVGCYFACSSPVVDLYAIQPSERLFKELLQINALLHGGIAFSILNDFVYLGYIREVRGLDLEEVLATFDRIGNYTDYYDDVLKKQYGVIRSERPFSYN